MNVATSEKIALSTIETAILRTLLYFDVFDYPILLNEIKAGCGSRIEDKDQFDEALERLVETRLISKMDIYYFAGEQKDKVEKRIKGNALAALRIQTGYKYSRLIAQFPYIEAVFLSGTISKGYIEPDGDIDYFIISVMKILIDS